jgi:hypothetical protein
VLTKCYPCISSRTSRAPLAPPTSSPRFGPQLQRICTIQRWRQEQICTLHEHVLLITTYTNNEKSTPQIPQKTNKQMHSNIHTEVPVELVQADSLGKDLLRDGGISGSTASSGDTVILGELRFQRKWCLLRFWRSVSLRGYAIKAIRRQLLPSE